MVVEMDGIVEIGRAAYLDHAAAVLDIGDAGYEESFVLVCAGCWSHCSVIRFVEGRMSGEEVCVLSWSSRSVPKSLGCEKIGCDLSKLAAEFVDEKEKKRREESRSLNTGSEIRGGVSQQIYFR